MRISAFLPLGRVAVLLAGAMVLGSCEKDEAFFTLVGPGNGSIDVVVEGTPAGATVRLTGDGVDETEVVDEVPRVFTGLRYGTYQVTVTPPAGYSCDPLTQTVLINAANPDAEVTFDCLAPFGRFRLSTSGLGGGVFLDASLTGPANRTGQLSSDALEFNDLPIGNYNWTISQAIGWNCLPASGAFTLVAEQLVTAQLDCDATEGGLSVTVTGATANVAYSGPETGGASVGATPTSFGALTPGLYTLSITNPVGFTCLPVSQQATVTAGNTTGVAFACTPQAQPAFLSYDFTTMPLGSVPAGTYTVGLRDGGVQVATTSVYTIGTQTFSGNGPVRLGAGFSSGYGMNYGGVQVFGQLYSVTKLDYCILNATLDAGHPVTINHRDTGGALLGSNLITMSPFCGTVVVPVGSTRSEFIAPTDRFFDFNLVNIRRD